MLETESEAGSFTLAIVAAAEPTIAEEKRAQALLQWLMQEFERDRKEASDADSRSAD